MSAEPSDPRIRVWVDFNDVDREGYVKTLRRFANQQLRLGDPVLAWDHDGVKRDGVVVAPSDYVATVRLTAPEWWTEEDARLAREEVGIDDNGGATEATPPHAALVRVSDSPKSTKTGDA